MLFVDKSGRLKQELDKPKDCSEFLKTVNYLSVNIWLQFFVFFLKLNFIFIFFNIYTAQNFFFKFKNLDMAAQLTFFYIYIILKLKRSQVFNLISPQCVNTRLL